MVGPRGDGYAAGSASTADEAAEYHAAQVASFAAAGADEIEALTMTDANEALGVALAAGGAGISRSLSLHRRDRWPPAGWVRPARRRDDVDAGRRRRASWSTARTRSTSLPALESAGPWVERIRGLRSNASTLTHAELDEAETLDAGDLDVLVLSHRTLEQHLPALEIVGGCCGTDARHVAALWGV